MRAHSIRELQNLNIPLWRALVVDGVCRTQLLSELQLGVGGGRDDCACAGGLGDEETEDGCAACTLEENGLAGEEGFETVERIPGGHGGDGEGGKFVVLDASVSISQRCRVCQRTVR